MLQLCCKRLFFCCSLTDHICWHQGDFNFTETVRAGNVKEVAVAVDETGKLLNGKNHYLRKPSPCLDRDAVINAGVLYGILSVFLAWVCLIISTGVSSGYSVRRILFVYLPEGLWNGYQDFLARDPILCKAVTSATVYFLGDILAQRSEGLGIGKLDRLRTLRSLVAGFCFHGPLCHFWYHISQWFFDDFLKFTAWYSVFFRVLVDQTVFNPIWNSTYVAVIGLMKRDAWNLIVDDIKRTMIPLIVSGLKLWPAVHIITYGVIPVENRLLWVDTVEIVWVVILSTQAAGREVFDFNDEETQALLDENDNDQILLHSTVIPERFFGPKPGVEEQTAVRRISRIFLGRESRISMLSSRRESLASVVANRRGSTWSSFDLDDDGTGGELRHRRSRLSVRGSFAGGQIWVM